MRSRTLLIAALAALSTLGAGCASLAPNFKGELISTMSRATPQFNQCYAEGLKRNPKLTGRLVMRLTVEQGAHSLSNINVVSLQRSDPAFEQCLANVAQGLQVGAPPAVTVFAHYPIQFSPGP